MDNQRFFLYIALLLVSYLLWSNWNQYKNPPSEPQVTQQNVSGGQAQAPIKNDVPQAADAAAPTSVSSGNASTQVSDEYISVETDVFKILINTRGADIHRAELLTYPVDTDHPDQPLVLLDNQAKTYISQSGLLHDRVGNKELTGLAPNHHDIYTTENKSYALKSGEDELLVPFTWRSDKNVLVTKTYRFKRGEFLVEVDYSVTNQMDQDWIGRQYRQLRHSYVSGEKSLLRLPTYTGAAYYDTKYEKLSFDKMREKPLATEVTGGWAGMLQHYFFPPG